MKIAMSAVRSILGETVGYVNPSLTVEDIRDHWAQIRNTDGYVIPNNLPEETALFFNAIK